MNGEEARKLVEYLIRKGLTFAAAESCTGGKVSDAAVSVPGASAAFKEGFITYTNEAKINTLGVSEKTIADCGAISAETALQMAQGARNAAKSDAAVSVTGNAGPTADEGKPVGLVYIGACAGEFSEVRKYSFSGGREEIRTAAADEAVKLLYETLLKKYSA